MKIVINRCFGGYGLSHKAVMKIAEMKGIELFPFCEATDENGKIDFKKNKPYKEGDKSIFIHYSTKPLKDDGTYEEGTYFHASGIERTDPILIKVVEEMGKESYGRSAELEVVEIPDDVQYEIDDYDGIESIHEVHRSWP